MSSSSSCSPAISGCATKEEAILDVCIEYDIDIDDVDMNNDSHIDWLCDLKNTHEVVSFQVVCECNLNSPRCIRLPGHSQLLIRINSLDPWRAGAYCELFMYLFDLCCLFAGWFVCEFVCLFACLFLLVFCNSQAAGPASSGRLARHQWHVTGSCARASVFYHTLTIPVAPWNLQARFQWHGFSAIPHRTLQVHLLALVLHSICGMLLLYCLVCVVYICQYLRSQCGWCAA